MAEVHLEYDPREPFVKMHQRETRWGAMVCHRRAGKTVACVHELVLRALYTKKKRAKYAYIGPLRSQAKEIAWEYLKDATDHVRQGAPRESDLKVRLHNGATITIYGADNPRSFHGLYFDGVVMDEYGDMRPGVWGESVLPTLMDRRGWAMFIGTMKGKNHFYKTIERAKNNEDWFHLDLKASESGILSDEDLREMRSQMTDAQYQQEMENNPNAKVVGTYYSELVAQMEDDGRIGDYEYVEHEMVHVSADLGFTDSTAFWFWQLDKKGPILIDYYENDSQPLEHYFDVLKNKGYDYADIWLPHDAKATTYQTGRSTLEQFIDKGLPVKIVPKLAVQHGIDAARMLLPQCRIDAENCAGGIEALRAYRRQFNEKTQQFSNTPLHDWASNGSDAFRYFALATDEKAFVEATPIEPGLKTPEWTLDQLWEDQEEDDSWRNDIIRL